MKLYAKIRSERAEKGQGGNTRLEIALYGVDRERPVAVLSFYEDGPGRYRLDTTAMRPGLLTIASTEIGRECRVCDRPIDDTGLLDRCPGHAGGLQDALDGPTIAASGEQQRGES